MAIPNTIRHIQALSKSRAARWHEGEDQPWSLLEWAGAMCGEAGESANFAKKLKRVETRIKNIDKRIQIPTALDTGGWNRQTTLISMAAEYKLQATKEAVDAVLYAMCLANAAGLDMEDILVDVFNEKSEEYGFPERLEKEIV